MRYFLTSVCFTVCGVIYGQNITLDQAISLQQKPLSAVEEFLTSKNWQMIAATDPKDGKLGYVDFAFNKGIYNDKAESFITYMYDTSILSFNRLSIQVNKLATYNSYITRLKTLGYTVGKSYVKDGEVVKIYKKGNLTIRVTTATQSDYMGTKTSYSFFICHAIDFYLQFEQ